MTDDCHHCLEILKKKKLKFGQLIKYNMRNISDEASYTKCGAESARPFSEKSKLIISQDQ